MAIPLGALGLRRLAAWALEAGLIAASGFVPLGLGLAVAQLPLPAVPLNPVLKVAQTAVATQLQVPRAKLPQAVPPLTNLLWTLGLIAPVGVFGWQTYQLAAAGQTWPKRWFKLKVVGDRRDRTAALIVLREGVRWGLPVMLTGSIGAASGAALGGWLPGVLLLCYLGEGAVGGLRRDRKPGYDWLAGTQVIGTRADDVQPTYLLAPPLDPFHTGKGPLDSAPPALYGYEGELDSAVWVDHSSGLTSIVLAPAAPAASTRSRLPLRSLSLVGLGGLVVGSVWGVQSYIQAQVDQQVGQWQADEQFLAAVQTLIATPENTAEYRVAILALARTSDPRTVNYLADLLTQTESPEVLATLQQALVGQGLRALPVLQQLNLALESDLAIATDTQQPVLHRQQAAVQQAIAKLLVLHDGGLAGVRLDKVNLGVLSEPQPFQFHLTEVDAAGTSWRSARLSEANLSGSRFSSPGPDKQANTYDDLVSDFSGADLKAVNLADSDLSAARLVRTNLLKANLSRSQLVRADLSYSSLGSAELIAANAAGSQLVGSSLVGADLTQADFSDADLTAAHLNRAEAGQTRWRGANLSKTQWRSANLSGADLTGANLGEADLSEAKLRDADLTQTNLQGASLRDADLAGVTLTGATVNGADFQGALLGRQATSNSFITAEPSAGESGSRFEGVDFTHALNLDGQQLAQICAQGGIHPACRRD